MQAFLRAALLLALLGVPACLLLAATAAPLVRAVFDPKWLSTIPVIQMLSIGMAFRLAWDAGRSVIQAQGRFRTHLLMHILYAALALTCVMIGALAGGQLGVATGVAVSYAVIGPLDLYVTTCAAGGRWRDVWRVYAGPMAVGLVSIAGSLALAGLIPQMPGRDWVAMALVVGMSSLVYVLVIRKVAPEPWQELVSRLRELAGPRLGGVLAWLR